MKTLVLLCGIVLVSGCVDVSETQVIDGQTVSVGVAGNGDTLKSFPYVDGTRITVRFNQNQATVTHVLEYPATDAQKRGFVEQASGCQAGALINEFNEMTQGGVTRTNYGLVCP